jgi:hypothetical protein
MEKPRVGAGRTLEYRSPSSRVIRTYYESVSVSATRVHAYTKDLTCQRRLSSPVLLAHPPVSARAPVDNAIEASVEAIEAICRERCRGQSRTTNRDSIYQNKAGGRHGAAG